MTRAQPSPEWMADAECLQHDPELFYPEPGQSSAEAKKVCESCPVQTTCLAYSLEIGDVWGVWGGLAPKPRQALRGKRHGGHNADKTACIRGHEFTAENTYVSPNGRRNCRKCQRAIQRRRHADKKAAA